MSLIKAAKLCFSCHEKYDIMKSKEVLETVYVAEEFEGIEISIKEAELSCLNCKGERPWLGEAITDDYVSPIQRSIKLRKRRKEKEAEKKIRRQERREMHKRKAPGKIIEFDLAGKAIKARSGRGK
jgi:hypothetical protein